MTGIDVNKIGVIGLMLWAMLVMWLASAAYAHGHTRRALAIVWAVWRIRYAVWLLERLMAAIPKETRADVDVMHAIGTLAQALSKAAETRV